jgi:hypothetical protein
MVLGALAVLALAAAPAAAASLYDGPGPRPGPDILYADPPRAPQLENTGEWRAAPILVSGATAYRDGEFLYQDFLYDDHGARYTRDPGDPRAGGDRFSQTYGTYRYPTRAEYAQNAADLVELRIKPVAGATLFRLTLNTMLDPELVGSTIAIGDSPAPLPMPDGAGASVPAQLFLTWHGGTAVLRDAATGTPVGPAPAVRVDTERRQVELRVEHAAWNPGAARVPMAAGVGLWDGANDRYLTPQPIASETSPGGGGAGAPAFFNVAFRTAEPMPDYSSPAAIASDPSSDPRWWRERRQGAELRAGSLAAFRAEVDFGKLAAGTNDDSGVPQRGPINRIFASRFETRQGVDFETSCGTSRECKGQLRGQLQPYSLYVPARQGPGGYGLTLLLHSLSANHNQFTGSRNQSQWAERGPGSLVATPAGRGPDGWYYDHAGADTFEVWADVARRYELDPAYTAIGGYSMGGYGTYKLATQFPDLFARAQPTVGPPGMGFAVTPEQPTGGPQTSTLPMLPSLRHVPIQMWVGTNDELVPFTSTQLQARRLDELGYRYQFWAFLGAEHFTLAANDQWQPSASFLGRARVDRNPARVTYVRNPTMDFAEAGTRADHAYWLSDIELRSASGASPRGTIDVRSQGFGRADPPVTATLNDAGALTGGHLGALPYQRQRREWRRAPRTRAADRLVITARNVSTVTVNVRRARVSCRVALDVDSDGPLTVRLAGCARSVRVSGRPRLRLRVRYPRAQAARRAGCRATVTVTGADRGRIRRVDFVVHGRRVARDTRAPFTRSLQRPRRRTVPLAAAVLMRDGRRLRLNARLRACGSAGPRLTG